MKTFIVGAKRTAIGSFGGTLKDQSPAHLSALTIKAAIEQATLNPEDVDETILGHALQAGHGMGTGRQASVYAGIPHSTPAHTINNLCGSGLKSVIQANTTIKAEEANIVVASGSEVMSSAPHLLPSKIRFGAKMGNLELIDHAIYDGLTDVFNQYHMGVTAENIVEHHNISRADQDRFAFISQQRAMAAISNGNFKEEIVPIELTVRRDKVIFDQDEYPKPDATLETLTKLRPAFKKDGTVTAGNSSGMNDGASTVIVASEYAVRDKSLKPLVEIVATSQAGIDPALMGLGPVPAIKKLLQKASLKLTDIEAFELNEAFAAQALGVIKELAREHEVTEEWIKERANLNGGAIALGHPIGASGNRVLVSLIYEMKRQSKEYGVATLCVGGGMGVAILVKNCD